MKHSITYFLLIIALLFSSGEMSHAQNSEVILRSGDSVMIKISGVPPEEINTVSSIYDVSDRGTINLPYIREVKAAGLRPSALQSLIENTYTSQGIYTHPTIQVTLNRETGTQVIYVSGEVKVPGAVPMRSGMSVHDAITSAGGPTDFAKMRSVKFTRAGRTSELDLRRTDSTDARISVQPGDRVHVP